MQEMHITANSVKNCKRG